MHPARLIDEKSPVERNRPAVAKQVLENGRAGSRRMHGLGNRGGPRRSAENQGFARSRPARGGTGRGAPPRLIDEQVVELPVELGAGKEPRRAGDKPELGAREVIN